MLGRMTLIAAVGILGAQLALPAAAQDESASMPRSASLGKRLQRFRQDLLGDSKENRDSSKLVAPDSQRSSTAVRQSESQTGTRSASAKAMSRITSPRSKGGAPKIVTPSAAPTEAMQPEPAIEVEDQEAERPQTAPAANVVVPRRMETQAARRAQGSGGLQAPPERTARLGERVATERRPADEARRKAQGADDPSDDSQPEEPHVAASAGDEDSTQVTESADAPQEEAVADDAATESESTPAEEPTIAVEETPESTDMETEPAAEDDSAPVRRPTVAPQHSVSRPMAGRNALGHASRSPSRSHSTAGPNVLFTTQSPVLSVEAAGPRKVLIGKEAEFVVKLKNSGAAARGVVVSISIPSYVDVAAARPTTGNALNPNPGEQRDSLEWKLDQVNQDAEETLTLMLIPRQSSPIDLSFHCTFTPEKSQTMVEVQEPKLAMSIAGPTEVLFGQSKIYKLTVSNPGNGDSENVTVGLMPIGRGNEGTGSHRLGTLKAGASKTIDVELTARQAGSIMIKAQAFADGGLRTEAAEQVLVRRANLQVEVEAPPVKYAGTRGTYRVKITNVGNATADSVQVAAMLPADAKYLGSSHGGRLEVKQSRVNWEVGTLQPGGQRVFEVQCALNAPGENRTQFVATADGDLNATSTASTKVEAIADLKLEVRDPQGPIAVGDEAVYEVQVKNRGTKAAEHVDLAVFFSQGLEAASAEGGPHDIGPGQVVFKAIDSIAAGDSVVFRIRARADAAGSHVFRAEVNCQSLNVKLAAEEATHFYGDQKASAPLRETANDPAPAAPEEAANEPTPAAAPAEEAPAALEPALPQ